MWLTRSCAVWAFWVRRPVAAAAARGVLPYLRAPGRTAVNCACRRLRKKAARAAVAPQPMPANGKIIAPARRRLSRKGREIFFATFMIMTFKIDKRMTAGKT